LLHHHGREKQMTGAEREKLAVEGTVTQGMVVHSESSVADRPVPVAGAYRATCE
jgi:hypothetical protein